MWPWRNYLTFLGLRCLVYKTEVHCSYLKPQMIFLWWGGTREDLVQQSAPRRYPFPVFPSQSLAFSNWGSEFLFATENILFSHTPLLFSPSNLSLSFPPLFFTSLCFSFLVSFNQLWLNLCPGLSVPWIVAAAFSLASLPPSGPLFYSPPRVFFHNLNRTSVLLCATHSSGFSSL